MKIVVNKCFGGFALSDSAVKALGLKGRYDNVDRTNPDLIALVEADSEKASGFCSRLQVVTLPDNTTDWMIDEYDGAEQVLFVVDGKIYKM